MAIVRLRKTSTPAPGGGPAPGQPEAMPTRLRELAVTDRPLLPTLGDSDDMPTLRQILVAMYRDLRRRVRRGPSASKPDPRSISRPGTLPSEPTDGPDLASPPSARA